MNKAEIEATVALFAAAGRKNIPVPIAEWKEMQMATAKDKKRPAKKTVKLTPLQKIIYDALTDRPESPARIALRSTKPLLKFESASRYCLQLAKLGMAVRHTEGQRVRWRKSDVPFEVVS